jgi:hypothetical protein
MEEVSVGLADITYLIESNTAQKRILILEDILV